MVLVTTPNHKILLDAGFHQSNDRYEDYLVNNRRFKGFKPKDIDLIFVSHCHLDHFGILPRLTKMGCEAGIVVSEGSKQILKDMMDDCANINERDVLLINAQHDKNYSPIYDLDDVEQCVSHILERPINQKIQIDDEISFKLVPSGHLINATQILLYITVDNLTKTLLYTGDLGNKVIDNKFVGHYEQVEYADAVIGESTYGDRPDLKTGLKERKNDLDKLKSIIDTQVLEMHGRLIIPVFANSRCHQMAQAIYEIYKEEEVKPKVYIDSPLTIKLFNDYINCLDNQEEVAEIEEIMNSDIFTFVKEAESSKALVASNDPCVILSTSGMCQTGRIRHHLKKVVPDPNATVLFVGFSTPGSLGDILKDTKRKSITIDQKEYPCRCSCYSLKSFSGHAPFWQLVDDYIKIKCQRLILHHGSKSAKETLKDVLEKEYSKNCQSTRVVIANSSLKFSL